MKEVIEKNPIEFWIVAEYKYSYSVQRLQKQLGDLILEERTVLQKMTTVKGST